MQYSRNAESSSVRCASKSSSFTIPLCNSFKLLSSLQKFSHVCQPETGLFDSDCIILMCHKRGRQTNRGTRGRAHRKLCLSFDAFVVPEVAFPFLSLHFSLLRHPPFLSTTTSLQVTPFPYTILQHIDMGKLISGPRTHSFMSSAASVGKGEVEESGVVFSSASGTRGGEQTGM